MIRPRFKTTKSGVPILKDTGIETDAELLLKDYNPDLLKSPQPLNVEDFTERYLGLNLHYIYLSHNGCILGRMVFNNSLIPVYDPELDCAEDYPIDADTVVIDNNLTDEQNECIFRSTMMHECGHYLYHAHIYRKNIEQITFLPPQRQDQMATTVCRTLDIVGTNDGLQQRTLVTDRDWVEHHAKYFSAAMLMPKSMVLMACNESPIKEYLSEGSGDFEDEVIAAHLSDLFNVSPGSAKIRIKQLDIRSRSEFNKKYKIIPIGYQCDC